MNIFLQSVDEDNFHTALKNIHESEDAVQIIARLASPVIKLADAGNNVAISVVQEATHAVANYITSLTDELNYTKNNIENLHDLKKYEWQKPHLSNQTGTEKSYHPNKENNEISKRYKAWQK